MASTLRLVGDIGGTNARFALVDVAQARPALIQPMSLVAAGFPCVGDAIARYFEATGLDRPDAAVIAFAGPIIDGAAQATNGCWEISERGLRSDGFDRALLINDYAALAYAAPLLSGDDLATLGPDRATPDDATVAVLGAGTGFGVSAMARDGRSRTPVVTEGGHIAFAPLDDVEDEVLVLLRERYGRVSVERILSGPGLTDLRWALGRVEGRLVEPLSASEIVARADTDPLCGATVDRFCAIYGAVAGDIALALGARGGVYLGGGIAPRILGRLRAGPFRERFEAKGRFVDYMAAIATRVIIHPYAALLGAATALED